MLKTLLKQIGDYRKDAILTPVFVILEVVMEVIIPLMMAAIIDYGLSEQNLRMVCLIGAAIIDSQEIISRYYTKIADYHHYIQRKKSR